MSMKTDLTVRWKFGENQSNAKVIEAAARLIAAETQPARIILFGSRARTDQAQGGDVDLLVVKKRIDRRRSEIVTVLRLLKPLRIPADILLYSEDEVGEWGHIPGTVLHDALTNGKVLYEAS